MSADTAPARRGTRAAVGVLGAAHAGPAVAVTVLAGLLCVAQGLDASRAALVVAAVLAGQLTIGWGNDLVDLPRDRAVGRTDKPMATGELSVRGGPRRLRRWPASRACCCRLALGWRGGPGPPRLVVGVGPGLQPRPQGDGAVVVALRRRLRRARRPWSPSPTGDAAAGGGGPVAAPPQLGVAAHFLNVLPDLADDAATGVRGLPHRLGGAPHARVAAVGLLDRLAGRPARSPASRALGPWRAGGARARAGRGGLRGRGRGPFRRRDRHRAGRRRCWWPSMSRRRPRRSTTSWWWAPDRPGRATALAALRRRPGAVGAAAGPRRLPARQVLRRRRRPARPRPAGRRRRRRRLDDRVPVARLRLSARRLGVDRAMARPAWVVPRRVLDARLVDRRRGGRRRLAAPAPGHVEVGDRPGRRASVDGRRAEWSSAPTAPTRWCGGPLGLRRRARARWRSAATPPPRRSWSARQIITFGDSRQPSYAWAFDCGDGLATSGTASC